MEIATKTRTIEAINERLRQGEAIVLTAQEFKANVRKGKKYTLKDVDVVTTATRGVMSGTAGAFILPVTGRGVFKVARKVWMNGVPGYPGPAPNERLGVVDCVVYGTSHSKYNRRRYGGGHLFRDLVERKLIKIEVEADDGTYYSNTITIDQLEFARLYSFRNAFKNYMGFANFRDRSRPLPTIFSFRPMEGGSGLSVSGTGELNPLQNDPKLRVITVGSKILINNAPGIVIGCGTRSSKAKSNLSIVADMFDMDPQFMGGFVTSAGPEVINSISIPIPVLDENVLADLTNTLDETVALPVADVSDRLPLGAITYADVWRDHDLSIEPDFDRCITCSFACIAEHHCPMGAISWQNKTLNKDLCFACGACTVNCLGGVFQANLGAVEVFDKKLPIIFRQSDRRRSLLLAEELKSKMMRGEFFLTSSDLPVTNRV